MLARRGWHANMPSCRIYPGALGLLCEKTQSARGPLQLAPVGLPLSEPPEGGRCQMNGGETRGRSGGGGQGKQQVFPGSGANTEEKAE